MPPALKGWAISKNPPAPPRKTPLPSTSKTLTISPSPTLCRAFAPTQRHVPTYDHALQTWDDALAILASWAPEFSNITRPEQLSFDSVSAVMASVPQGFQRIADSLPLDDDASFFGAAVARFTHPPADVLVIPDCGMVSRRPFRLPVVEFYRFAAEFVYESGAHRFGLLDGASDLLLAFDTGDIVLVDHDERVWFTPSTIATP